MSLDETLPYTPIGEALQGLEIRKLDDGTVGLEAVVLVKCLDAEGDQTWSLRYTQGVSFVELIGALTVALDHHRANFQEGWVPDANEDDD